MAVEHAGPRSLRQLLEAVLAVGSDLDLTSVLQRIIESAVRLVDARYGALGVLDEAGTGLAQFITVGIDDETRAAIGPLPKGLGILGLLIDDARPLRLAEISEHPASAGFPPNHPPMDSFLGVPIRVGDHVFGNLYLTDKTTDEVFTDIDEELVLGLASAAGVAINNAALFEERRRAERERAGLHEVATALLAGTDTHAILEVVASRACQIVDADLATIALHGPSPDELTIEVAVGEQADAVLGQVFPASDTITARIMQVAEPIAIDDLSRDKRVAQPQVRLGTIGPAVFVPLGPKGNVLGSLAVSRVIGADPFTTRDLDVLQQFAIQASVVIEQGRTRDDLHRLSLLEDQERIARDLHDTVIQRLFATGLSLQGATRLVRDDEVRRRIEAAVDELDTVVRHIRTVIFDVETTRTSLATLRRRVLDVAREAARPIGFQPQVTFEGPVDVEVSGPVADDLLATLREALSNVARHAGARAVTVDVCAASGLVTLVVTDDGIGAGDAARRAAKVWGTCRRVPTATTGASRSRPVRPAVRRSSGRSRPRPTGSAPLPRSGARDAPPADEIQRHRHHMAHAVRSPVRQRQRGHPLELGLLRDLARLPGHAHAPTAVREGLDVVDLERDDGVAKRGVELGAFAGAHEDAIAVDEVVHGEDHRERTDGDRDAADRRSRQQPPALVGIEQLKPVPVHVHSQQPRRRAPKVAEAKVPLLRDASPLPERGHRGHHRGVLDAREALVEWLGRRAPDLAVEVIETHISILGFQGERVYKCKKPVRFPFIDLSTEALRAADCEREVELNRRFAPDVYLGVLPVTDTHGVVIDHAVEMVRLADDRRLAALATSGADTSGCLDRLADDLVAIHRDAPTGGAIDVAAGAAAVADLWRLGVEQIAPYGGDVVPRRQAECVARLAGMYVAGRDRLFDARVAAHRARDGHGDLLAQDVFCLDDGPRAIDCLEFDARLRYGDVLADIAFLAMDLEHLGRGDLAASFLDRYRAASGDDWPASLEHMYIAYRAHVRAKIACLRHSQGDPSAAGEARALLALSHRHLETGRIRLVLVGGPPASGKTTLAAALGERMSWPVIRTDVMRKQLAGLDPTTRADAPLDEGLYAPARTDATYAAVLAEARTRLEAGTSVIVDASWSNPRHRALAHALAHDAASVLVELECWAPDDVRVARAARRAGRSVDASDAGPELTKSLGARFAPWPGATNVDTRADPGEVAARVVRHVEADACDRTAS